MPSVIRLTEPAHSHIEWLAEETGLPKTAVLRLLVITARPVDVMAAKAKAAKLLAAAQKKT